MGRATQGIDFELRKRDLSASANELAKRQSKPVTGRAVFQMSIGSGSNATQHAFAAIHISHGIRMFVVFGLVFYHLSISLLPFRRKHGNRWLWASAVCCFAQVKKYWYNLVNVVTDSLLPDRMSMTIVGGTVTRRRHKNPVYLWSLSTHFLYHKHHDDCVSIVAPSKNIRPALYENGDSCTVGTCFNTF